MGLDSARSEVFRMQASASRKIHKAITEGGSTIHLPHAANEKAPWRCYYARYKERYLVECFLRQPAPECF